MAEYDAIIVGAGPNGLAAAITLAQRGLKVVVLEAGQTPGGGARTGELTLPGFRHDICSAIHPLGQGSPFFRTLGLERYGLNWIHPGIPAAQAMDNESAFLYRNVAETAQQFGRDERRYRLLLESVVADWNHIDGDVLGPLGNPRHPWKFLKFGLRAPWPALSFLRTFFRGDGPRALLGGIAAHATLPLEWFPSFAPGLVLALAGHRSGWPLAAGGTQSITSALVALLRELGGEVICNRRVASLKELPSHRAVLLDITPRQLLAFPEVAAASGWAQQLYRFQLRQFRYGPGVFKLDYALSGPIPWKDARLAQAGTVHLGGTLDEMATSERAAWKGVLHPRPYVLVAQQSLFDPTRAPAGKHTAWAYCHVPAGYGGDAVAEIEGQLERFAPGFRDCVLAKASLSPSQLESYNANYVGGDIGGGALLPWQLFTRPVIRPNPYSTPFPGVYLCSSSTPPGAGVHGMCGHHAALAALKHL